MMGEIKIKGGNGDVTLTEDTATKRLRNTGKENNIERFSYYPTIVTYYIIF